MNFFVIQIGTDCCLQGKGLMTTYWLEGASPAMTVSPRYSSQSQQID